MAEDGRVTPKGTSAEVGPEAFQRTARVLDDLRAISASLERILPEHTDKALRRARAAEAARALGRVR